MVTYEEQLLRLQETNDFVEDSYNTDLTSINSHYRNLYDSCLSDPRCNLDIFVKEHNLDPDKLDASIIDPIKYTELREVLAQREVLLDAGYKLTDFDANNFDPEKSVESQIQITYSPKQNQPNLDDKSVTFGNAEIEALKFFTTTSTSTEQNDKNNYNEEKTYDNFFGDIFTKKETDEAISKTTIAIVAGAIAIGLGLVITKRKK